MSLHFRELWGEYYLDMSKKNTLKRAKNLEGGKEALEILVAQDFEVVQLSDYHFRINGRLDVWPSSKKAYDIKSHIKKSYNDLEQFVKQHLSTETPCK